MMFRHLTKDDAFATLGLIAFLTACAALWMELPA